MNLLAIDSAGSILSIAIAKTDEIFYTETDAGNRHSELVMGIIDSQMKKASLAPEALNGVICMGGPGSFTGLRIGFSIAKGLALSLSIPFITVPTLECIAFPHRETGLVFPVIEARKNAWFFAVYQGGIRLAADTDAQAGQIAAEIEVLKSEKITLTGPGAVSLYDSLPREQQKIIYPVMEKRGYAKELITIAKNHNMLDNDNNALLYSGPEYIRKTDAELNLL